MKHGHGCLRTVFAADQCVQLPVRRVHNFFSWRRLSLADGAWWMHSVLRSGSCWRPRCKSWGSSHGGATERGEYCYVSLPILSSRTIGYCHAVATYRYATGGDSREYLVAPETQSLYSVLHLTALMSHEAAPYPRYTQLTSGVTKCRSS